MSSISITIVSHLKEWFSKKTIKIDRMNIEQLTIDSLAQNLNQFPYEPHSFKCWCKGKNDSSFVNMINDKLLICLLDTYWADCDEFLIIFRHAHSRSPNSSTSQLDENQVCPLSNQHVSEIYPIDQLTIANDAHSITVDSNYIIGFIESQLNKGF